MISVARVALESKLKAWADAQVPPIPIAFESAPFTKPATGTFLQPIMFTSITLNRNIGATQTTDVGFLQVNCWARQGYGMGEVDALTNSVAALYPTVPKVGPVSIERPPSIAQSITDVSGWICVPVTIKYRYET